VNLAGSTVPAASGAAVRHAPKVARVAVLGASGYSGQEFVRLALAHPGLALAALGSREFAGRTAADLVPGLDPRAAASPPVVDVASLSALHDAGAFDTLVVALPHGAWREIEAGHPALALGPERVVDLSADHRDGSAGAAGGEPYEYGLPEAFRDRLIGATRIANPGCYPTAAALALLPAAEAGWLSGPIMVNALSGVSGAGRAATLRTSFVELEGGASLYKAGTEHGHVAEMERSLARMLGARAAAGGAGPIGFAPHLVPMARGILLTASAPLASPMAPEAALLRYRARFEGEPFVNVLAAGQWPETRAVRGSNRCDLAVTTLHGGRTLLAAAAIDNLVKGAAGQALQNLNLMLGWPEDTALPRNGAPW
jgi:N-acetyl-gamma-glutamyl-phosphate reductase